MGCQASSLKSRENLPTVVPEQYIHIGFCEATTGPTEQGYAKRIVHP